MVLQGIRDFKKGLGTIFGKPEPGKGDRRVAKMSKIIMAQIPLYGKAAVRKQLSISINNDLKRAMKKGGEQKVDEVLNNALNTPEYMELCRKVGIEKRHLMAEAAVVKMRKDL